MAALDTPWTLHMSSSRSTPRNSDVDGATSQPDAPPSYAPPTYAAFSPANLSSATSAAKRKSTILVHQKSPLLLATPPQVTRALAYSHPFLLPLNKLAGLVSWTTGDPWESFLLLVIFWAVVQYGDVVLRLAAPIVTVMVLIAGMYGRRFSPLSSSGWTEYTGSVGKDGRKTGGGGGGHQRATSENTSTRHQKTLDEIVDTLRVLTTRCNILMEPLLEMTDFLSTQRTATSATTRPALTTLFVRILAITPIWIILTLPPFRIITTKRVVLVFGTLFLTWHSKACRISRTLLWRSATLRRIARGVTGLPFEIPSRTKAASSVNDQEVKTNSAATTSTSSATTTIATKSRLERPSSALTAALKGDRRRRRPGLMMRSSGVRFTFILYENQRRWVGLGWTGSLFAYERAAWTDEQNNPMPSRDDFELPEVEDDRGSGDAPARWRWVGGGRWRVDGAPDLADEAAYDTDAARNGWVYYDNKWQNGRRGLDGWNRWTRRRKWYRDAELVEIPDDDHDQNMDMDRDRDPTPVASREAPVVPPQTSATAAPTDSSSEAGSRLYLRSSLESKAALFSTSNPEISSSKSMVPVDDDASLEAPLSTSSKSTTSSRFKWPTPGLRRRTTGGSTGQQQQRPRRTSEESSTTAISTSPPAAADDDDDVGFFGALTPALQLEIQGHRKGQDTWGIGDEAQMGLE